jgi:hypothetical protein
VLDLVRNFGEFRSGELDVTGDDALRGADRIAQLLPQAGRFTNAGRLTEAGQLTEAGRLRATRRFAGR